MAVEARPHLGQFGPCQAIHNVWSHGIGPWFLVFLHRGRSKVPRSHNVSFDCGTGGRQRVIYDDDDARVSKQFFNHNHSLKSRNTVSVRTSNPNTGTTRDHNFFLSQE